MNDVLTCVIVSCVFLTYKVCGFRIPATLMKKDEFSWSNDENECVGGIAQFPFASLWTGKVFYRPASTDFF